MKKVKVFKFIELHPKMLQKETITFLNRMQPTYKDMSNLNEHMYYLDDIQESPVRGFVSSTVMKDFARIERECQKAKASYFRIQAVIEIVKSTPTTPKAAVMKWPEHIK